VYGCRNVSLCASAGPLLLLGGDCAPFSRRNQQGTRFLERERTSSYTRWGGGLGLVRVIVLYMASGHTNIKNTTTTKNTILVLYSKRRITSFS